MGLLPPALAVLWEAGWLNQTQHSLGVNSPGQGHPGVLHHLVQPGKVSLELVPAVLAANAAPLGLIGRMQTGQGVLHREVAQWRARLARDSLLPLWGQASPSREGF